MTRPASEPPGRAEPSHSAAEPPGRSAAELLVRSAAELLVRSADVLLADGATVHLRPVQPDDADAMVALHSRFSQRTRYLRYFSPYPRIPPRDLVRFVEVDHWDREAFVAELDDRLIAVGRYERLGAGAPDAEVAFVVEDAHQGRGVGSALLEHLAAAALEVGITRFVAEVLPENAPMLRVFADAGYQVRREYADGVVHLDFPIAPSERSRQVQERREHRAEATSVARLLNPRGIAVYGASRTGRGVGASVLGYLRSAGFAGPVVAVHPSTGPPAVPSLVDAGVAVDLAVVAVPAAAVPVVVADAAAAGVHGLVVLSSGFAEAGPAGAAAQQALLRAVRAHGMRLVGPNCFGLANPAVRLNATLAPQLPAPGRVGLFSQSGAFGIALLAEADRRGVGLSSFASVGNRADVSGNDLLQYWQDDPGTDVLLLYLETVGNPRKFARLARGIGRHKPIVAVSGLVRPPALVAAGGPDAAGLAALFASSGVIRVDTVPELFDVADLLAHQPLPAGDRVGVVTNMAPLGALAADACIRCGLVVAAGYPRDIGSGGSAAALAVVLRETLADLGVDSIAVALAPSLPVGGPAEPPAGPADADPGGMDLLGGAVAEVVAAGEKPVVATLLAGPLPTEVRGYPWVEEAARALGRVSAYARWRREPPGAVPDLPDVDPDHPDLLAAYGIRVVPSTVAEDAESAVAAAREHGFPVAVKVAAEELRHRHDLGAVRLDVRTEADVRAAYQELVARFGGAVLVQRMVAPGVPCGVEVVVDPAFGPVVGFGLSGPASELLGDRAWRPAPLTDRDAAALVRAPRAAPLLAGADHAALADLLLRVGRLADEHPEVRRLAANPVLARPDGLSVLHASLQLGERLPRPDTGPRRL
ncbi:MAG TPA: GNAT family N-acetyltransferase [Micromonosporaceae bacterium]|nr:GNAT family N-acetyltransferase [Micromonosporaceae bacterium]